MRSAFIIFLVSIGIMPALPAVDHPLEPPHASPEPVGHADEAGGAGSLLDAIRDTTSVGIRGIQAGGVIGLSVSASIEFADDTRTNRTFTALACGIGF